MTTGFFPSVVVRVQGEALRRPGHAHLAPHGWQPLPLITTLAWCEASNCCDAARRSAHTGAPRLAARMVLRARARFDRSLRCQLGDELRKVITYSSPELKQLNLARRNLAGVVLGWGGRAGGVRKGVGCCRPRGARPTELTCTCNKTT